MTQSRLLASARWTKRFRVDCALNFPQVNSHFPDLIQPSWNDRNILFYLAYTNFGPNLRLPIVLTNAFPNARTKCLCPAKC